MSATKGPWTIQPTSSGGGLLVRGETAGKHPQHMLQIVPIEDARLIAAAPDLLEACKRLEAAVIRHGSREHPPEGDVEWAASFQELMDSLKQAATVIKLAEARS